MSLPYFSVVYHTIMLNFIDKVLCHFESCFSRKASFCWFIIITVGLMLRSDKLGITSVIRDLALAPGCYSSMIHFFRSSAWSLESIRSRWFSAVKEYSPLYKEGNFHILVGDGVKQTKKAARTFWKPSGRSKCIWLSPALPWESSRVFPSVRWGNYRPTSFVIKERLPKEGYWRLHLWPTCGNIFSCL